MKHLKVWLALACAFGSGAALADGDTMRYGIEAAYPPFESKTPSGELVGMDIDVGKAVCKAAKLTCTWVETSFDGLIPALNARKFDAINSAMNATDKRREAIDFTHIVYRTPTMLVARTGSGLLPTVESLKGKRVAVQSGTIQELYAKAHWEAAGIQVVPYQDQNQAYADLVAGRVDGTLILAPSGTGFLSRPEGKGFSFVGGAVHDDKILGGGIAYGLRKGDEALKKRLDAAIDKLKADGTVKAFGKKYFGDIDISAK
jgi:lysine/arginine/ornithine transport system substrate-binding protein